MTNQATLPSRRALVGYPSVLEPATSDCAFDGPWGSEQPRELRFGDGGPIYVTVFRAEQAHLELTNTSAFVELVVGGFRLWGHVDRTVSLHPARAFVLAGYLLPGFHAKLHPISATPGQVTIEMTPPKFVEPRSPPRDTRPCSDLGLDHAEIDPASALGEHKRDGFKLPANTPIPLAAAPESLPAATLSFDEEPYVSVIEQRGELARIVVDEYYDPTAGTSVVGWVPRSLVVHVGAFGHPGSWSSGAGPSKTSGLSRAKRHVRCTRDVPLVIDLGHASHLAGAITAGTKFGVLEDGGNDTFAITFDRVALELAPGARALVKQAAMIDCADVPR